MAGRSISDVPEVFNEVFGYLNPDSYTDQEKIAEVRQALLNSALTCRNLVRPALNVLWTCLPSDEPLLNLLSVLGILRVLDPESNFERVGRTFTYPSLDDPRTHPRWEEFYGYASRVRTVTLHPFNARPSVWADLVPLLRAGPVLPALREVVVALRSEEAKRHILTSRSSTGYTDGHGVLQLMSPSVRQFCMSFPRAQYSLRDRLEEVFREACTMSPQLEHVRVYSGTPLSLEVLQSQKRLRTVEVNAPLPWARSRSALVDAPPHGLTPLSNLPRLESLSLTLSQASPAHLTFDHVRVLVLTGVWHPMEVFLDSALLPQLRSLTISVPHEDPARLSPQCASHFRVLADKHTRLTELHLKCYKSTVHNPVGGTPVQRTWQKPAPMLAGALCAVIEPLLKLHELRNVSLSFGDFCFAYDASDIQCLAESWPDIETFRLELTTLEQLRAGFESLVHFAEHCPRLRALHLPEMELTHDAFDKIRYPKRPHPLRELNVARVVFPQRTDLSWEMLQFSQRVFPHAGSPVSESA